MLLFIIDPQHPVMDYIKDDPVRPEIPKEFRVGPNRFISALVEDKPSAIVCINLLNCVPKTVGELGDSENPTTAVFYTIWSYIPGAGTRLLRETVKSIREKYPTITRFVTLSPKTDMARKFHIRNGAIVLSENDETVNYEYL
jgi:hypothetical protein